MKNYNTTQLNPEIAFEKHVFHRDMFAHYLRWTYVLNVARIGMKVLDFGAGSGNLAEVFYRNKYKCKQYLGLEYKEKAVSKANEQYKDVPWASFEQSDLTLDKGTEKYGNDWDIITSFEVAEHIGKNNIDQFFMNVISNMNDKTTFIMSTPNFNEKVGAAGNHTYDSGDGRGIAVQEFEHKELQEILERYFTIEKKFGTFASQTHYKHLMTDCQKEMFDELNKYYDSNLISNIMAPMFPEEARNCLWSCTKKK